MRCIYTIAAVELIGGVEKREIEVAPPDPAWPERFVVERAKIVAALGAKTIRVDHIGSTSIPGIAAKPIIDTVGDSIRHRDVTRPCPGGSKLKPHYRVAASMIRAATYVFGRGVADELPATNQPRHLSSPAVPRNSPL